MPSTPGRVRILIGSTEKMGAGTNVQRRLAALHHLDAPWRPRDIEQREGRILRQGNLNAEVRIFRYVTEGSFDAYMWQTLETKARFIQQVMNGQTSVRSRRGPRRRRAHLRRDQGHRLGQSGGHGKGQNRYGNPQARPVARGAPQPAAQHPPANPRPAFRNQGDGRRGSSGCPPISQRATAMRGEEFSMTVGNRVYSGKGAREEGAAALTHSHPVVARRPDAAGAGRIPRLRDPEPGQGGDAC